MLTRGKKCGILAKLSRKTDSGTLKIKQRKSKNEWTTRWFGNVWKDIPKSRDYKIEMTLDVEKSEGTLESDLKYPEG